jgi:anti-sigma-K factor RskA
MTDEKLTLEETLDAIKQQHEDLEDVKAVLAMSSQELDQKLEEQGFDVKAVEARGAAREAEIRREQDHVPFWRWLVKIRGLVTAFWVLLAAAATHAADVWRAAEPMVSSLAHAAPPELRQEAFAECGKMHWQSCLQKLDEAATADPQGDKNPDVQKARAFARQQLGD